MTSPLLKTIRHREAVRQYRRGVWSDIKLTKLCLALFGLLCAILIVSAYASMIYYWMQETEGWRIINEAFKNL